MNTYSILYHAMVAAFQEKLQRITSSHLLAYFMLDMLLKYPEVDPDTIYLLYIFI